jgi:hypothetical protein
MAAGDPPAASCVLVCSLEAANCAFPSRKACTSWFSRRFNISSDPNAHTPHKTIAATTIQINRSGAAM